MTISDIDIYRTARLIIDQFGDQAEAEAFKRQSQLQTACDFEGVDVWKRVLTAITELQNLNGADRTKH